MATPVRHVVGPTILLHGGSYFDFDAPEASAFTIEDIAHGLSMLCRFTGQCRDFYSVAQHSVLASRLVAREHAYAALLHDAAEAFLGDVSKPLKVLLSAYCDLEERVEAVIARRFNLPIPMPAAIKDVDLALLATEQRQLMNNHDAWSHTHGRAPLDIEIECWPPARAKLEFLARFAELGGGGGMR